MVGFPNLSKATPLGIFLLFFSSNPQSVQNFFGDYMEKSREYFSNIEKQMQANSDMFFRNMGETKQHKKDGD